MCAIRGGKKNLIVAFHFQFSNSGAWRCDTCRRAALEFKRRCGWIPAALDTQAHVVWSRKHVAVDVCPRSLVSGQSLTWLEEFLVMRKLRQQLPPEVPARKLEAFLILEEEYLAEERNAGE